MKKSKKKSSSTTKEKQRTLIELLQNLGTRIYDDLDNGQFPKFTVPSRSVSNIVYDEKLRQYILGNNSAIRSSKNTSQLRSFTQLMWLAFFANRLTKIIYTKRCLLFFTSICNWFWRSSRIRQHYCWFRGCFIKTTRGISCFSWRT